LVELGREDAKTNRDEIERFFTEPAAEVTGPE